MARRLLIPACLLSLVPAGGGRRVRSRSRPPPGPHPRSAPVTAAGLMGATVPASFRRDDPVTAQSLENLVFDLESVLAPPPVDERPDRSLPHRVRPAG